MAGIDPATPTSFRLLITGAPERRFEVETTIPYAALRWLAGLLLALLGLNAALGFTNIALAAEADPGAGRNPTATTRPDDRGDENGQGAGDGTNSGQGPGVGRGNGDPTSSSSSSTTSPAGSSSSTSTPATSSTTAPPAPPFAGTPTTSSSPTSTTSPAGTLPLPCTPT